VLYGVLILLWSIATIALGFVSTVPALMAIRMLVGALEAPSYPINNRVVTTWFPERGRATAIGVYTSGQYVGVAFLTPVLVWLQLNLGWHMVFVATGILGLGWAVVWYLVYRQPHDFPGTNAAEIDLIRAGGGLVDLERTQTERRAGFSRADLARVLSSRKLWGVYFGQFALTSTLWFFLTWFPTYLVQARGMDFVKVGFLASLPFLAAFVGVLSSGLLSDYMVRRGASLGVARKAPIVTGLLLSTSIVGANFVEKPAFIIAFMTLAFFGNGLASITWSLVSAIAPERLLGLTGGVFNFFGNLSGISVPIIIGYLARDYGFSAGLAYVAVLALLGAVSYVFVVGTVERLPDSSAVRPTG
jgi:ACS family D-galactonate transporter-like MFS transporter